MLPVEGLQTLAYAELDLTQDEVNEELSIKDDIRVTEAFDSWWKVEMEDMDEEDHGNQV